MLASALHSLAMPPCILHVYLRSLCSVCELCVCLCGLCVWCVHMCVCMCVCVVCVRVCVCSVCACVCVCVYVLEQETLLTLLSYSPSCGYFMLGGKAKL